MKLTAEQHPERYQSVIDQLYFEWMEDDEALSFGGYLWRRYDLGALRSGDRDSYRTANTEPEDEPTFSCDCAEFVWNAGYQDGIDRRELRDNQIALRKIDEWLDTFNPEVSIWIVTLLEAIGLMGWLQQEEK